MSRAALAIPLKKEIVKRELEAIAAKHQYVSPELVLTVASSPTSPLHAYFEWDDGIAAREYRLEQARRLIMIARVVSELGGRNSVRALVPAYDRTKRFFPRAEVMGRESERSVQYERALSELRSWVARWVDMTEFDAVRKVLKPFL